MLINYHTISHARTTNRNLRIVVWKRTQEGGVAGGETAILFADGTRLAAQRGRLSQMEHVSLRRGTLGSGRRRATLAATFSRRHGAFLLWN